MVAWCGERPVWLISVISKSLTKWLTSKSPLTWRGLTINIVDFLELLLLLLENLSWLLILVCH
jgi:hypothetical protein